MAFRKKVTPPKRERGNADSRHCKSELSNRVCIAITQKLGSILYFGNFMAVGLLTLRVGSGGVRCAPTFGDIPLEFIPCRRQEPQK